MRIGIDTEKDSPDSIRKVIKLLHELVNEPYTNYATSQNPSSPLSSSGVFNMFGPAEPQIQQTSPSAPPSLSSSASSPNVFDIFKNGSSSSPSGSTPSMRDEGLDDDPDDDPDDSPSPSKPILKMKESDPRAKKFQFPEDQISIIEY